jgi:hypothetical protein
MSEAVISTDNSLVIDERFRGPPFSGNGGYVAGRLAGLLGGGESVEVTLRSPIPMDRVLDVEYRGIDSVVITEGETLIAQAIKSPLELDIPAPPSWDETLAAKQASFSFVDRVNPLLADGRGVHPICFCCGAEHEDGLEVFAAPVQEGAQVAAIWKTKTEWAEDGKQLPDEFLWAALDCPGQFAYMADGVYTGMLGRITGKLYQSPQAGDELLVTGWRAGVEGKKHSAGTAIFNRNGELVASALALWIGRRDTPEFLK